MDDSARAFSPLGGLSTHGLGRPEVQCTRSLKACSRQAWWADDYDIDEEVGGENGSE